MINQINLHIFSWSNSVSHHLLLLTVTVRLVPCFVNSFTYRIILGIIVAESSKVGANTLKCHILKQNKGTLLNTNMKYFVGPIEDTLLWVKYNCNPVLTQPSIVNFGNLLKFQLPSNNRSAREVFQRCCMYLHPNYHKSFEKYYVLDGRYIVSNFELAFQLQPFSQESITEIMEEDQQ